MTFPKINLKNVGLKAWGLPLNQEWTKKGQKYQHLTKHYDSTDVPQIIKKGKKFSFYPWMTIQKEHF